MPTDTEIWERACERVGLWKRGQRCNGFQRPSDNDTKVCVDCGATKLWYGSHTIPAPAIGDPTAVVAMLRFYARHTKLMTVPTILIDNPLTLANAVLAVLQESQS